MLTSNGITVEKLAPPTCENCGTNPAFVSIRNAEPDVDDEEARDVCKRCVMANDGRPGWPYYSDVVAGFVGFELA